MGNSLSKPKPPAPDPAPFVCVGHHERAMDTPEIRALKHIANALDPRGPETSRLVDVLDEIEFGVDTLAARLGAGNALLERIAAAVERLAPSLPDKATDLGGAAEEINKGSGFPPAP